VKNRIVRIEQHYGLMLFRQRFETRPDEWFVIDRGGEAFSFDTEAQARSYFNSRVHPVVTPAVRPPS